MPAASSTCSKAPTAALLAAILLNLAVFFLIVLQAHAHWHGAASPSLITEHAQGSTPLIEPLRRDRLGCALHLSGCLGSRKLLRADLPALGPSAQQWMRRGVAAVEFRLSFPSKVLW